MKKQKRKKRSIEDVTFYRLGDEIVAVAVYCVLFSCCEIFETYSGGRWELR